MALDTLEKLSKTFNGHPKLFDLLNIEIHQQDNTLNNLNNDQLIIYYQCIVRFIDKLQ